MLYPRWRFRPRDLLHLLVLVLIGMLAGSNVYGQKKPRMANVKRLVTENTIATAVVHPRALSESSFLKSMPQPERQNVERFFQLLTLGAKPEDVDYLIAFIEPVTVERAQPWFREGAWSGNLADTKYGYAPFVGTFIKFVSVEKADQFIARHTPELKTGKFLKRDVFFSKAWRGKLVIYRSQPTGFVIGNRSIWSRMIKTGNKAPAMTQLISSFGFLRNNVLAIVPNERNVHYLKSIADLIEPGTNGVLGQLISQTKNFKMDFNPGAKKISNVYWAAKKNVDRAEFKESVQSFYTKGGKWLEAKSKVNGAWAFYHHWVANSKIEDKSSYLRCVLTMPENVASVFGAFAAGRESQLPESKKVN